MRNFTNTKYTDEKIGKLEFHFYILALIFTFLLTKIINDKIYKILALSLFFITLYKVITSRKYYNKIKNKRENSLK